MEVVEEVVTSVLEDVDPSTEDLSEIKSRMDTFNPVVCPSVIYCDEKSVNAFGSGLCPEGHYCPVGTP